MASRAKVLLQRRDRAEVTRITDSFSWGSLQGPDPWTTTEKLGSSCWIAGEFLPLSSSACYFLPSPGLGEAFRMKPAASPRMPSWMGLLPLLFTHPDWLQTLLSTLSTFSESWLCSVQCLVKHCYLLFLFKKTYLFLVVLDLCCMQYTDFSCLAPQHVGSS